MVTVVVLCPKDKCECKPVLRKTLPVNKDILFVCPKCKMEIPVRLYKTKYDGLWYFDWNKKG